MNSERDAAAREFEAWWRTSCAENTMGDAYKAGSIRALKLAIAKVENAAQGTVHRWPGEVDDLIDDLKATLKGEESL